MIDWFWYMHMCTPHWWRKTIGPFKWPYNHRTFEVSSIFCSCPESRGSPDWPSVGLWLNPSGTLVILVVEIRFSTQQGSHLRLPAAPYVPAAGGSSGPAAPQSPLSCARPARLSQHKREIMQERRSSCRVSVKLTSQLNRRCWLFTTGLWEGGLCVSCFHNW